MIQIKCNLLMLSLWSPGAAGGCLVGLSFPLVLFGVEKCQPWLLKLVLVSVCRQWSGFQGLVSVLQYPVVPGEMSPAFGRCLMHCICSMAWWDFSSVSTNLWRRLLPGLGTQVQFHFCIEWKPVSIWGGCLQLSQALTMSSSCVSQRGIWRKHLLSPVSAAATPNVLCLYRRLKEIFKHGVLDNVFILLMAVLMLLKFPSALWIYGSNNFIFPLLSCGVAQVAGLSLEQSISALQTRNIRIIFILGFSMLKQF